MCVFTHVITSSSGWQCHVVGFEWSQASLHSEWRWCHQLLGVLTQQVMHTCSRLPYSWILYLVKIQHLWRKLSRISYQLIHEVQCESCMCGDEYRTASWEQRLVPCRDHHARLLHVCVHNSLERYCKVLKTGTRRPETTLHTCWMLWPPEDWVSHPSRPPRVSGYTVLFIKQFNKWLEESITGGNTRVRVPWGRLASHRQYLLANAIPTCVLCFGQVLSAI